MWQNNDNDKIKNHLHTESFCFKTDGFVLYVLRHRLHTTTKKNNTAKQQRAQEISIIWFNCFFCDDGTCKKTQFRHGETWIYRAVTKSQEPGISPGLLMSMTPSYFRSKQKENENKRTPWLFSSLAT